MSKEVTTEFTIPELMALANIASVGILSLQEDREKFLAMQLEDDEFKKALEDATSGIRKIDALFAKPDNKGKK